MSQKKWHKLRYQLTPDFILLCTSPHLEMQSSPSISFIAPRYFPLSYYRDIQYNYGSSVSVPGRPSWSRRFLFSKMVRKREATAFCSISHFENICAYSICFSDGLITFFNLGHSIQCICVSSLLKQRGHRLSF